jgi:hypothetical protein
MIAPDCVRCEDHVPATTRDAWGEPICDMCEGRDQDAYDEGLARDFYGGSGPVTMAEHMDAAYKGRQR